MDIYGLHSNGFLWYKHPMGCMIFRSKAGKFWALSSAKLLPCQQGILRPPTTARQNVCSTVCFAGKACSSWWYYIYIYIHIHIYVSVCACLCGIDAQVCIQCMQSVYTGDFWSEWVTHGTIGVSWGKKWLYIYIRQIDLAGDFKHVSKVWHSFENIIPGVEVEDLRNQQSKKN